MAVVLAAVLQQPVTLYIFSTWIFLFGRSCCSFEMYYLYYPGLCKHSGGGVVQSQCCPGHNFEL